MPSEEAKTFAGKAAFVASSMFGRVGRCAMRAIWNRAASNDHGCDANNLTPALDDSLKNLTTILLTCPPRTVTMNYQGKRAIIYAGAYFLGERCVKIGQARDIKDWQVSEVSENGWGFIVTLD